MYFLNIYNPQASTLTVPLPETNLNQIALIFLLLKNMACVDFPFSMSPLISVPFK
jgi:hypothetical protein